MSSKPLDIHPHAEVDNGGGPEDRDEKEGVDSVNSSTPTPVPHDAVMDAARDPASVKQPPAREAGNDSDGKNSKSTPVTAPDPKPKAALIKMKDRDEQDDQETSAVKKEDRGGSESVRTESTIPDPKNISAGDDAGKTLD